MNPKAFMLGGFTIGLLGSAVGISNSFDGQLISCTTPHNCQSVPEWAHLQQSGDVRRVGGSAGWKILGALAATVGFTSSMVIARGLVAAERQHLKYQTLWDTTNLEKLKRQSELELQTFTQQATLQAAEAAYAILEPYEQPLLEGMDSLDPGTKLSAAEPASQPPVVESVKVTAEVKSEHGCQLFDWKQFKTHPDDFAHIRIIGKTGGGKTMLADWLLDVLEGQQFVVTIKRKPKNWRGLKVYGLTRNYEACRQQLKWVLDEMDCRFELIDKGVEPEMVNFVVDEWRSISQNCKTIKHRDETGEEIIQLGAKDMMKEIVTLARDAKLRMIALAQGEQVKTWGLEDESDLGDCFTTIRIGDFATDYAKTRRGHYRKDSEDYAAWTAILAELKQQGRRCCMVEDIPARIPDLSNWQRESSEPNWLERTREQLENYLNLEGVLKAEPPEPNFEPLNQPSSEDSSQNQNQFTPLNLTRDQVHQLIKQLRTAELNQTQIIEHLWQVRKGGSTGWKDAYNQFKEIDKE